MWNSFKEFILTQCDKNPTKIAEIGVGKFDDVYNFLNQQKNIEIIKTDISPNDSETIRDDIFNPNLEIYKDIDIVYSIRPPSELQPQIYKLANNINATLIIKPLFNEDLNIKSGKMKLKNYKKASFYISK